MDYRQTNRRSYSPTALQDTIRFGHLLVSLSWKTLHGVYQIHSLINALLSIRSFCNRQNVSVHRGAIANL